MQYLSLQSAVGHIRQAGEEAQGEKARLPFFFIVGAGVSHPVVPLATKIEADCRAIAAKYGRAEEKTGLTALDRYSHWFQKAFPNPIQRQHYLRGLIEERPISQANLRLAHLVATKQIANLVVTPNFDDFLRRALELFGETVIICDHPSTVERIDPERGDLQIVHVHGTYWFYDCCNLRSEIEERAQSAIEQRAQPPLSMASFLDNLLSYRSPLVVGYSGWEGDVIMTALKRRLVDRHLPYNLYWFCYKRQEAQSLPEWLKNHPGVYLVAPDERPIPPSSGEPGALSAAGAVQVMQQATGLAVGEDTEPTLPARDVFGELLQELPLPALTRDPLGYLASRLKEAIPTLEDVEGQRPLYFFPQVLRKVEQARQLEREAREREEEASRRVNNLLEQVQAAIGRSSFAKAVEIAEGGNLDDFSEEQLRDLTEAMEAARSAALESGDTLRAFDVLVPAIEALLSRDAPHAEDLGYQLARVLSDKALMLFGEGRYQETAAACEDLARASGLATDAKVLALVAHALGIKGNALWLLGRTDDALGAYREVVERFGEATDTSLQHHVGGALLNQGGLLIMRKRNKDALAAYQRGLDLLSRSPQVEWSRLAVARGLLYMSIVLQSLRRREEAAAACDEVVKRFGEATEPELRDMVREAQDRKRELAADVRPARASAPAKGRRPSTPTKGQRRPELRPGETEHSSTTGQRRQRRERV